VGPKSFDCTFPERVRTGSILVVKVQDDVPTARDVVLFSGTVRSGHVWSAGIDPDVEVPLPVLLAKKCRHGIPMFGQAAAERNRTSDRADGPKFEHIILRIVEVAQDSQGVLSHGTCHGGRESFIGNRTWDLASSESVQHLLQRGAFVFRDQPPL
jgi:hypothetical protein